jgi:hypothetical protein
MFNDHDENGGPSEVKFEEASIIHLYENSKLSNLCATLLILNCCQTHGTSNAFISELLRLLKNNILPTPNTSPSSEYEASHMLKKLGLAYEMINVCIKGCMLFRGVHANVDHCVHCGEPWYIWAKRLKVARKVFHHFSLLLQLAWMYNIPTQTELMVWHHHNRSQRWIGLTSNKFAPMEFCGSSYQILPWSFTMYNWD